MDAYEHISENGIQKYIERKDGILIKEGKENG